MAKQSLHKTFATENFLASLKVGDNEALEQLVHAYTEDLYRGALGLGFNSDAARELVQNVWVAFMQVVSRFEGRSHVRTFLFGILYNKASEMRRQDIKFVSSDPIEEVLERRFDSAGRWAVPPIDPEQFFAATELREFIRGCIDALPIAQRMAFCLREIDEHKTTDICNILNVTSTNLGVLLFRARNRLRECVERKSVASPSGKA